MVDTAQMFSEQMIERELIHLVYDEQTLLLTQNLEEDIEKINETISQLFTNLIPIYKSNVAKL